MTSSVVFPVFLRVIVRCFSRGKGDPWLHMNDEKEPRENDKCMEKRSNANGDTAVTTGKKDQAAGKGPGAFKDRVKALKSNKYALVIVILCILVIILFIVIIALAVQLGSRLPVVVPYCDTSDCLHVSSTLKAAVDESIGNYLNLFFFVTKVMFTIEFEVGLKFGNFTTGPTGDYFMQHRCPVK